MFKDASLLKEKEKNKNKKSFDPFLLAHCWPNFLFEVMFKTQAPLSHLLALLLAH
jgi:hypothetical protein